MGKKGRVRGGTSGHEPAEPAAADCGGGGGPLADQQPAHPELASASGDSSPPAGRTMSFLRSRLYKAKSLGSLMKERILVEASHCQYEIWKRFGLGPAKNGDVNMNGVASLPTPVLKSSASALPGSGSDAASSSVVDQQQYLSCSVGSATVLDSSC